MSGYDIVSLIHKEINTLISSATIYALPYSMEREGLARDAWRTGKRLYVSSERRKEDVEDYLGNRELLVNVLKVLISIKNNP